MSSHAQRLCADRLRSVTLCGLFWTLLVLCGCSRFPAIDPNGQSIFLPHPASTELRLPHLHARDGNPGVLPQDAFPAPPPVPPCVDGSCQEPHGIHNLFKHKKELDAKLHAHFQHKDPGKCGEIQLSPLRVVAPVGGEVLLLAGICGKDGYLVKREPLEWMLSPDSVGQFIEVGDDAKGRLCASLTPGPKVEKLDVDYARGRTSSRETLITRGTPGCDDDLQLKEGQTWLTVSSPSEGVSRVTVLAPDSELWDRRRQTAIIYWVDSQANFPPPVAASAPGPVQLVTRVTRAENLVPAQGWDVRYTILDPRVAAFVEPRTGAPIQATSYVAQVDQNGMATVSLVAPPGARGTTPVHIEVIRPAQPSENLPELILQQGDTMVTFSSPGLLVTSSGPEAAAVGDVVTYVASMANPGDVDAENSRLVVSLPAGSELIEVQPQPTEAVPGTLAWVQNLLPAGRQLDVIVTVRLNAPQDVAVKFVGTASGNLTSESSVVTRVVTPSVRLRFEPVGNAAQAEIGELITYEIDATNTGPQTLVNLLLEIETSPGLQHPEQGSNVIQVSIPMLQPGQTDSRGVRFRVMQEGQHTAVLRVKSSAGGAVLAERQASILGLPRRPKQPRIEAGIRIAPQAYVGAETPAVIEVANRGETVLTGISAQLAIDTALEATAIDQGNAGRVRAEGGGLVWGPPDLQPGQIAQLIVNFRGRAPTTQAGIAVTATSGAITANARAEVQLISRSEGGGAPVLPPGSEAAPGAVLPPGSTTPSTPAAPAEQQRTGQWSIRIIDLHDPTTVNAEVSYDLIVVNNQNLPDRDVHVQLVMPEGVSLRRVLDASRTAVQPNFGENRIAELPIIQYVRPGEQLRYTFVIQPTVPQQIRLTARVFSAGRPTPEQVTEPVTVNAR